MGGACQSTRRKGPDPPTPRNDLMNAKGLLVQTVFWVPYGAIIETAFVTKVHKVVRKDHRGRMQVTASDISQ